MFQRKKDKLLKDIPNLSGIANDILLTGHVEDSINHVSMLCNGLQIYRKETFIVFLASVKRTLCYIYMHIYCDMYISKNLLLYVCTFLYIQKWCTLVDYIHDAYWLHYIQYIGVLVNDCLIILLQPNHPPSSYKNK